MTLGDAILRHGFKQPDLARAEFILKSTEQDVTDFTTALFKYMKLSNHTVFYMTSYLDIVKYTYTYMIHHLDRSDEIITYISDIAEKFLHGEHDKTRIAYNLNIDNKFYKLIKTKLNISDDSYDTRELLIVYLKKKRKDLTLNWVLEEMDIPLYDEYY